MHDDTPGPPSFADVALARAAAGALLHDARTFARSLSPDGLRWLASREEHAEGDPALYLVLSVLMEMQEADADEPA